MAHGEILNINLLLQIVNPWFLKGPRRNTHLVTTHEEGLGLRHWSIYQCMARRCGGI